MSLRLSRRHFLKAAGTALAVAPFASLLNARRAHAQGQSPLRTLVVYIPDGCIPDRWHPTGSETSFSLPVMSDPMERIKQHCVFVDGLEMFSGDATHEGGIAKLLTGVGAQSIDVFLGQQLGSETPHASLHLGVAANFQNGGGSMSFIGEGQEVTPDDDPLNAFDRLFAGAGSGGGDEGAAALAKRRRKSVLDTALADVTALQGKLGTLEREKLDVHMDSLRELERRLTSNVASACDAGGFNRQGFATIETDYYPKTYEKEENFRLVGDLQMDLAVLALSCNVTRVASIMWSHCVSPTHILETGVGSGNHDASHYGEPNSSMASDFTTLKRWFVERFVELIDRLANTPDGPGQTLLDNTQVLLCTELGESNLHDIERVPFVLVGGAGGQLRTGRYVDYRGKGKDGGNETHTKLLVSMARAMGVSVDSFGYTGHGTGSLEGLYG